jgi:hypothetical protein
LVLPPALDVAQRTPPSSTDARPLVAAADARSDDDPSASGAVAAALARHAAAARPANRLPAPSSGDAIVWSKGTRA